MSDAWIGKTLSKVAIERKLGRGGMAEIYLGRHTTLDRPVAVKILHGYLADDPSLRDRIQQEARAVASLRHPNIVQVLDFDISDDRPYIVMELLEGISLFDFLQAHHEAGFSLPIPHILKLIRQIASALDYAHNNQIIHRDIKPSNVMLRQGENPLQLGLPLPEDAQVVLTDFGIARITGATRHTSDGSILGTPHYMSPEQINGQEIDLRSDIYALGVMAYEMVAGQLPFGSEEDTPTTILYRQVHEDPPPIPNTDRELQAVIMRCLAKDKQERYASAGAFAQALEAAFQTPDAAGAATVGVTQRETRLLIRTKSAWLRPILLGAVGLLVFGALFIGLRRIFRPAVEPAAQTPQFTSTDAPGADQLAEPPTATQDTQQELILHGSIRIDEGDLVIRFTDPLPALERAVIVRAELADGTTLELGEVESLASGADVFLTTPDGRSLLGNAEAIVLLTFLEGDPAGIILGRGGLPAEIHQQFSILEAAGITGDQEDRILTGVSTQESHYESHLQFTLQAIADANIEGARAHAEHTINILSGASGEFYGDWNGNDLIENPGDDIGLQIYLGLLNSLLSDPLASSDEDQRASAQAIREELAGVLADTDLAMDLVRQVALADSLEIIAELALGDQLDALNLAARITTILERIENLDLGYYLEF